MKKIIFASGLQIFPAESGGQLRSSNLCLSLAELGYNVEIYSFTGRKRDYLSRRKKYAQQINKNLTEHVNLNPLWGLIQYLFYKFSLPPLWLTFLTFFYVPKALREKIKNSDILILDFPFLYPLTNKTTILTFINTHNAEYELSSNSFVAKIVKKIELKSFAKAKAIFFCSLFDQEKFIADYQGLPQKSFILPNGINFLHFQFDSALRKEYRKKYQINERQTIFLFTGSSYTPNIEALASLKKWSRERSEELIRANIIFLVVGSVSHEFLHLPYLIITGKVPNIAPYFWAADFALNPVVSGSGTNVKIAEYLAAKLPILTTVFGSRGFSLVDNESCLFFEPATFMEKLTKARQMTTEEKVRMAKKAMEVNLKKIDMTENLKSLQLKW